MEKTDARMNKHIGRKQGIIIIIATTIITKCLKNIL